MTAPEIARRWLSKPPSSVRKVKALRLCKRSQVSLEAMLACLTEAQREEWSSL